MPENLIMFPLSSEPFDVHQSESSLNEDKVPTADFHGSNLISRKLKILKLQSVIVSMSKELEISSVDHKSWARISIDFSWNDINHSNERIRSS